MVHTKPIFVHFLNVFQRISLTLHGLVGNFLIVMKSPSPTTHRIFT